MAQFHNGWNTASQEIALQSSAKSVADLLPRVLQGIRFDKRQEEAQIVKVWNASIDPTLTAHAQPTGIHKGTLFVSVDNNTWLSEIVRYRRREILSRLQTSLGSEVVQRISFRVGA